MLFASPAQSIIVILMVVGYHAAMAYEQHRQQHW